MLLIILWNAAIRTNNQRACANGIKHRAHADYVKYKEITLNSKWQQWFCSFIQIIKAAKICRLLTRVSVCFISQKLHDRMHLESVYERFYHLYYSSTEIQRLPNEYKVGSSCLRTNRLLSHDVKSPCSYFILQIKQGFMREFGLRCQRGPLQSCLELRKKSNRKLQRWGWEEVSKY